MTCTACGAATRKGSSQCLICGFTGRPGEESWDRTVEAVAYDDLSATNGSEPLIGFTRGKLMGSWRPRSAVNPRTLLSPFANLGLTSTRLLIQPVSPRTGRGNPKATGEIPLRDILAIRPSDVDPVHPGRTIRLAVQLKEGEAFRIRATGRLASGAADLANVWRALIPNASDAPEPPETCEHCGRNLDRPYRYCPFCGKALED